MTLRIFLQSFQSGFNLANETPRALQDLFLVYVVLFRKTTGTAGMIEDCSAFREIASAKILRFRENFLV
jgi:hypothetical protein